MAVRGAPYYVTAYGLAVKHGFTGTEKEWVLWVERAARAMGSSPDDLLAETDERSKSNISVE